MRCFIAINIEDPLKKEIGSAIGSLGSGRWDVKWVSPENLHITLAFLGDIPDDSVPRVNDQLSAVSKSHAPFEVSLCGTGVFPDRKRPRVVWIGLSNPEKLKVLQNDIEQATLFISLAKEDRSFSPHLTIGRIRSLRDRDAFIRNIETLRDRDFGNIGVKKISFMRSELKPAGAQYSIVAEFPLTKEER
jgi:2'-5' RNA ligase